MTRTLSLATARAFWRVRQGNAPEEWEDAFACNDPAGRFAVADGASESIYAGEWARLLCEAFVADPSSGDRIGSWLEAAQQRWVVGVDGRPAPWHIAEKLEDGAFATFLGLRVATTGAAAGRWRAVATGDTCLFHVRPDGLRRVFPVRSAADFGTRPDLIGSRQRGRVRAIAAQGTLATGDQLLLMTDALAEWFLKEYQAGRAPWHELDRLTEDGFAGWVDAQRADGRLKNDDVTLVVIATDDRHDHPASAPRTAQ